MPPPNQLGSGNRPRLRDKLVAFFAVNPDEQLSLSDVVTKFGVDHSTAQQAVLHMRAAGLLADVQAAKSKPLVVTVGPALREVIGSPSRVIVSEERGAVRAVGGHE